MSHRGQDLIDLLGYLEPFCCIIALAIMQMRRQVRLFAPLSLFLVNHLIPIASFIVLNHIAGFHLSNTQSYQIYFWIYWPSYAVQAVLGFLIIHGIYNMAMAPLKGLQRLGTLMFRWAAGIAVAIALTMAFGPHVTSQSYIVHAAGQLQETQSVITLCMLLFVCLAVRPMGLSHSSKIFGVSLGLGVLATADLVGAAWLSHFRSLYSVLNLVNGIAICTTLIIWTGYFAIPEPKRRMIILPTTSPFLRWNQISLALGDEPGFVAIGEVTPEMFAPAEVEVMRRASLKMRLPIAN